MLSEKIRQILEHRHMSIHYLSVIAGIPYTTLHSIVRRKSKHIDQKIISKIASALNISEAYFWTDDPISDTSNPESIAENRLRTTIESIIGRRNRLIGLSVINDYLLTNKSFIEICINNAIMNNITADNDKSQNK